MAAADDRRASDVIPLAAMPTMSDIDVNFYSARHGIAQVEYVRSRHFFVHLLR
jgi:hypothetical protein